MDNSTAVIKRWRAFTKGYMAMLMILFVTMLIEYFMSPVDMAFLNVLFPIRDLIVILIWYAICDHCACEKRGHKIILLYCILQVVTFFVSASQMIVSDYQLLSALFLEDAGGPGFFLAGQHMIVVTVCIVVFGFMTHSSYQLFKVNRALNRAKNETQILSGASL